MAPRRTTIVWFRRDLRLHDNPALARALADGDRVAPLFVLDERLLAGRWPSPNRLWWMRGVLTGLAASLEARGATLAVTHGDPSVVVPEFAAAVGARRVLVSRDYTPYGRRRDACVATRLRADGVGWAEHAGLLVHEPEEVASAAGMPFRVFGPFRRTWMAAPLRVVLPAPSAIPAADVPAIGVTGAARIEDLLRPVTPTADPGLLLAPGEDAARGRLDRWAVSTELDRYATDRDRLDLDGTSRLSQDLRWGTLSPVEIVERCAGPGEGRRIYLSQLAWRDFYAHVMWNEPHLARAASRPTLEAVAWVDDPAVIDAWRDGRTGYPVVDAAMRQLRATGWMHNRARMLVASFLTKHLGVDWRVGERHFMEHLVDGDPASNNGGWQWAASTGTNPQPWFRIFNPRLQGLRHDPHGDYVSRWVPELAAVGGAGVHGPPPGAYLAPLVDHAVARDRALAAYRAATRGTPAR